MKKISESDSRMLDAGRILVGQAAKQAGNMPDGWAFYTYCTEDNKGWFTNRLHVQIDFMIKHAHIIRR